MIVTVGAAGAPGTFDYTCDGVSDHTQINAAIADCAAGGGGTVQLSPGTFYPAGHSWIARGVSLAGTPGTVLQYPDTGTTEWLLIPYGSQTVSDLELLGHITLYVTADDDLALSDFICQRVVSRETYNYRAFCIYVRTGGVLQNILFEDCEALDTTGYGFFTFGGTGTLDGVTYRRCRAVGCGILFDGQVGHKEFVCGFCPSESKTITLTNVLLEDCYAENCWLNGIHIDGNTNASGNQIVRCESVGNTNWFLYDTGGALGRVPTGGRGFAVTSGWTATDCTATGNRIGFLAVWDGGVSPQPTVIANCVSSGSEEIAYEMVRITGATVDDCTVTDTDYPAHIVAFRDAKECRVNALRAAGTTGDVVEIDQINVCYDNQITYYLDSFAAAPAAPVTGETVTFSNGLSDIMPPPAGWIWDFGDGDGSSGQNPSHTFAAPGPYVVSHAAGANTVTQTVTVVPGVSYGGARLSEADLGPIDHDPVANATDLHSGRVGVQGSSVSRKAWTINALADDRAEIEALAALKGQHLTLNINGVDHPGVMIRPPMLETQLTPSAWAYQVGFVQETRHA